MEKEGDHEDEEEIKERNIGMVEEGRTSQPSLIHDKVVRASTVFLPPALPSGHPNDMTKNDSTLICIYVLLFLFIPL